MADFAEVNSLAEIQELGKWQICTCEDVRGRLIDLQIVVSTNTYV